MIDIIAILICIGLIHIFVFPVIMGFYRGYRDAKDGRPYNTDTDEDIED